MLSRRLLLGLKPFDGYSNINLMSATEILKELPKLSPTELEAIYRRAVQLHQGQAVEPTPELLAAIDEADGSFAKEGGVGLREARSIVAEWNTK